MNTKTNTNTKIIVLTKTTLLHTPLVGRPTIQKLRLVMWVSRVALEKTNIEAECPELFSSLGRMRGNYKVQLCENATPYSVSTPRRVLIPLLPKVQTRVGGNGRVRGHIQSRRTNRLVLWNGSSTQTRRRCQNMC